MKQLFQNLKDGETIVAETPIPTPQGGEALIRTVASLVSAGTERMVVEFAGKSLVGKARSRPDLVRQMLDKARREGVLSTLDAAFSRLQQPMALGYSSAGMIVELGGDMTGFRVGQWVACAGGGYAVHAEYAAVPRNLLAPLPDGVDFDSAAFSTLGAIALHGFRLSQAQIGERVAVIGLGLLGLLTVEIANASGCQVFGVDLDLQRVKLANTLGAHAVARDQALEAALSFSNGQGCDAVLICADTSSDDPVELAGLIARDRARVIAVGAVGLKLPRKIYYEKELSFLNSRSYGPGRYDPAYEVEGKDYPIGYVRWTEGRNLSAFVDLLGAGRVNVKPLISHRFSIDQAPQAYELITGKRDEPFLGVLLTYPGAEDGEVSKEPRVYTVSGSSRKGGPTNGAGGVERTLKIGVLGAGNFATAVMLPVLKKSSTVELIGIGSASGMNARYASERFGFRYATSDEAQILADPLVDTLLVLTRHNLHARQVIAGLRAGKSVFCEKPLVISKAELKNVAQALQEAQMTSPPPLLTVGFNRRFAPLAKKIKSFIDERSEPLYVHYRVNAGFIPLTHWTHNPDQGGGRIIGEVCHFIDFIIFLVGAVPNKVSGYGLPDAGRYQEDNLSLSFQFPDGSLGIVSYLANGDKAFPKERVEVFSSGRTAVLEDFRSVELVYKGRRTAIHSRLRQDKGHRSEWEAFSAAVRQGGPPTIPYEQIFGGMWATFASVESLREGTEVQIVV